VSWDEKGFTSLRACVCVRVYKARLLLLLPSQAFLSRSLGVVSCENGCIAAWQTIAGLGRRQPCSLSIHSWPRKCQDGASSRLQKLSILGEGRLKRALIQWAPPVLLRGQACINIFYIKWGKVNGRELIHLSLYFLWGKLGTRRMNHNNDTKYIYRGEIFSYIQVYMEWQIVVRWTSDPIKHFTSSSTCCPQARTSKRSQENKKLALFHLSYTQHAWPDEKTRWKDWRPTKDRCKKVAPVTPSDTILNSKTQRGEEQVMRERERERGNASWNLNSPTRLTDQSCCICVI